MREAPAPAPRAPSSAAAAATAGWSRVDSLCALILAGLAIMLRAAGADFGLPAPIHEDEVTIAGHALLLAQGLTLPDEAWRYPPAFVELGAVWVRVTGCGEGCTWAQVVPVLRGLSVLAGAVTVTSVFAAARVLNLGRSAAVASGALMAWLPLAMRMSRYAKPDAWLLAGVALCVLASACIMRTKNEPHARVRVYVLAGCAVGLAAAAKYNGALAACMIVAAHLVGAERSRLAFARLCLAGLVAASVFLLSCAWPWAGFDAIAQGLRYEWWHYGRGHDGFTTPHSGLDAATYLFRFGWGWLPSLLTLGGLTYVWARDRSGRLRTLPFLVFVLAYFALVARQQTFFARTLLPLLPALALLLAFASDALLRAATQRWARTSTLGLAAIWVVMVAGQAVAQGTQQIRALRTTDSRLACARWLEREIPTKGTHLIVSPTSAWRSLPSAEHFDTKVIRDLPPLQAFRNQGFTHLVYGAGSHHRFRRAPQRYGDRIAAIDAWYAELTDVGTLLHRCDGPQLPGASHFGDAGFVHHQYAVEVWALNPTWVRPADRRSAP